MPETRTGLATLGLILGTALVVAGAGHATDRAASKAMSRAQAALASGDGIAAEVELRRLLDAGSPRPEVAAAMGEAMLLQGDPDRARGWLDTDAFSSATEGYGWRMRGRLEQAEGNLPAAGRAYDRALQADSSNSQLWVDIGRLRYAGGEQLQAIAAAEHAVELDPNDPRAIEFRGQTVRDRYGLIPALSWFERGLELRPDDLGLLGEYAATLGELGRAHEMLRVTRHMLALQPGNARALFLQGTLAARAGKLDLARDLLGRAGKGAEQMPAALLLRGIVELNAGNANLAVDALDRLIRSQPANGEAGLVLARAAYIAGDSVQLRDLTSASAAPPPSLLALQARAQERDNRRDLAAHLLARAAAKPAERRLIAEDEAAGVLAAEWKAHPGALGSGVRYVRKLLALGDTARAAAIAEALRDANPGSGDAQAIAGDVQLLRGNADAAIERYAIAAQVRVDAGLLARYSRALDSAGMSREADRLVEARLAGSPTDTGLNRLAAERAQQRGDWARVAALADYLIAGNPRMTGDRLLLRQARLALGKGNSIKSTSLAATSPQSAKD